MNEIVKKEPTPLANRIVERLSEENNRDLLIKAVGDEKMLDKFLANVAMEISATDALKKCTPNSLIQSAIQAANLGLMVNKSLGHAWLIPYQRSFKGDDGQWQKVSECQLQIGYKGYVSKFEENGYSIEVELVTTRELEQGNFKEIRGTNPKIEHSPIRDDEMRVFENIALAYAVAFKTGRKPIIAVMTKKEILEAAKTEYRDPKLKKKVQGWKGVWNDQDNMRSTDFGEMCKKTVIRRLSKSVPVNITNHMLSFEGERDEVMKDVSPIEESVKPTTNMSFISGVSGAGLAEQDVMEGDAIEGDFVDSDAIIEGIPEEFPIMLFGEVSEGMFTSPIAAANYIKQAMSDQQYKEHRLTLIRENGALIQYLIKINASKLIDDLHKLADEGETEHPEG